MSKQPSDQVGHNTHRTPLRGKARGRHRRTFGAEVSDPVTPTVRIVVLESFGHVISLGLCCVEEVEVAGEELRQSLEEAIESAKRAIRDIEQKPRKSLFPKL